MNTQPIGRGPGLYFGLSNDDYHADPAISSSSIKKLRVSPLEYWYNSPLNPNKEQQQQTPAMKLGTAYHMMLVEPHLFAEEFTIISGPKTTTKEGCITEHQYSELLSMLERIHANPRHKYLFQDGYPEVSIFWRDERTGLMCKCRYDFWNAEFITDFKTIDDVHRGIRSAVPKFGYDISGAMYMQGALALKDMIRQGELAIYGGDDEDGVDSFLQKFLQQDAERFVFLFQGKKAPYISRALPIAPDVAEVGLGKFYDGLDIYAENIVKYGTNPWPAGYPDFEDMTLDDLSDMINFV